jgi:hypothetical protein
MKIDKTKLMKLADIAKDNADKKKAAKDAPTLDKLAAQIADLTKRIKVLEPK